MDAGELELSRFNDHWKTPGSVTSTVPDAALGESPGCGPPVKTEFGGIPIWIHPTSGEDQRDDRFVSDDGQGFLPNDAIANVQLERYVQRNSLGARKTDLLKRAYYLAKPFMTRELQLKLQRANAKSRLRNLTYPNWPHDDSLRSFLHSVLARILEYEGADWTPFIGFWPHGHHWAACFTHDVETAAGLGAMGSLAHIEETLGIRSTWFFVPERYPVSPADFQNLQEAGHEIGVHGLNHDGRLFASREEFDRRVVVINRYIKEWGAAGFRSPALHRNPDWIPDLAVRYDSSFIDTAVLEPQAGGVSTVFPYHLAKGVVELPITMPMDHHFINLLQTDCSEPMLTKFTWVTERHGLANFLYHPDYNLDDHRVTDYGRVVDAVSSTPKGWVTTAAAIADWWARRHASELIQVDGAFRVEGPAADDAAIWHAYRENGTVRIVADPENSTVTYLKDE